MYTSSLRRSLTLWVAVSTVFFTLSCATLSGVEPPTIHLAGLRVVEMKGFETAFEVDLRVLNPNDVPLSIQGIDCDLALNDRPLAKGVANPQTEIPAYGSDIVTVTVYASVLDLFGAARRLIQEHQKEMPREKWSYAINGHLDMGGGAWAGKIPFDAKGEIDLEEMMGRRTGPK